MSEPKVARLCPFHEKLESGKRYAWCACGLSKTQPFCDGSHKSTDIEPLLFTYADATGPRSICACKRTATPPYCDGAHRRLMVADGDMEACFPAGVAVDDEHSAKVAITPGVPTLPVKDCPATIRYYADVLGFHKVFDDAAVGFEHTMYACMQRGELKVILDEHAAKDPSKQCVIAEVDNVDALFKELDARGAIISSPLTNRLWQARDFCIEDNNGHRISFTMPLKKDR